MGPLPALTVPGVCFGSFNNFVKISRVTLDLWAAILRKTPASRLLLNNRALDSRVVVQQMRVWFASRGIGAECLELLGRTGCLQEHLPHDNRIDISLDTFPYHDHGTTTTTCGALWMGVSLLTSVGLGDLVARALGDLAELWAGLRQRLLDSPLMA